MGSANNIAIDGLSYNGNFNVKNGTDGVTNGTTTFTSASGSFTAAQTGQRIVINGAGVAGAPLETTITFVNSTTLTLGVAATSTASGQTWNLGFGGICINDSSSNTDITFRNMYVYGCDDNSFSFTASGSGGTGPTRVQLFDNRIVCTQSAVASGGIWVAQTVTDVTIRNNNIDCSQNQSSTSNVGPAAINIESGGLTTTISNFTVTGNHLWCANDWCLQVGPFNAYQPANFVITDNTMNVNGPEASGTAAPNGCASIEALPGLIFTGNICNANGTSLPYTGFEVFADRGTISNNTCNLENPGTAACFVFIILNNSSITGNVVNGFGENGGGSQIAAGFQIGGTHADQAISTLNESGNIVTVVATGALNAWFQPGVTITITGSTTAGYNISGLILNTSYSRTGATFTMYNPTSGLASCSGACTTSALILPQQNNNTLSNNTVTLPCSGTLASSRYGFLFRATGAGELVQGNRLFGNKVIGCGNGATGDVGISMAGSAAVTASIFGNDLVNLATGIQLTSGSGSVFGNTFTNVASLYGGGSLGLWMVSSLPGQTNRLTADSASITATTAATAVTQFSFANLLPSTNYVVRCTGRYIQATAASTFGIAVQGATNAPTLLQAAATVSTGATSMGTADSGNITTTTYTQVAAPTVITFGSIWPFSIDINLETGASAPTLNVGFFSGSASDAINIKRGSQCTVTQSLQ